MSRLITEYRDLRGRYLSGFESCIEDPTTCGCPTTPGANLPRFARFKVEYNFAYLRIEAAEPLTCAQADGVCCGVPAPKGIAPGMQLQSRTIRTVDPSDPYCMADHTNCCDGSGVPPCCTQEMPNTLFATITSSNCPALVGATFSLPGSAAAGDWSRNYLFGSGPNDRPCQLLLGIACDPGKFVPYGGLLWWNPLLPPAGQYQNCVQFTDDLSQQQSFHDGLCAPNPFAEQDITITNIDCPGGMCCTLPITFHLVVTA